MKIRGLNSIKKLAKSLFFKTQSRAVILLYHRVIGLETDPQLLSVSPKNFADHLQIIKQFYNPISLQTLVQQMLQGKISDRSVVITFDDGYADNLYQAKPLLEQYQIPATIFVTTGQVGNNQEFWWDDLERIFLQPNQLPEKLSITIQEQTYNWELGKLANYTKQEYQNNCNWNVLQTSLPSIRHQIYLTLCPLFRLLPIQERHQKIREIIQWSGLRKEGRSTHLALSPEGVKQLEEGGLIEVAAHTVNHPVLSRLSQIEQYSEIQQSKNYLESLLEHPIVNFAYPYGNKSDYTLQTAEYTKDTGFISSCSNFPDIIWQKSNLSQLPRILVRDYSKEKFIQYLKQSFYE